MSNTSPMTLSRDKRLRKRRDFLRVQKFGARYFGRFVVAVAQRCKEGDSGKVGFTVPKKVGAAHVRNKIKRRLRHIVRVNSDLFLERTLVVVARDSAARATFAELQLDLIDACRKLKHHRPQNTARPRATVQRVA